MVYHVREDEKKHSKVNHRLRDSKKEVNMRFTQSKPRENARCVWDLENEG